MNKEKALKNQGLEFREDIIMLGGLLKNIYKHQKFVTFNHQCSSIIHTAVMRQHGCAAQVCYLFVVSSKQWITFRLKHIMYE